MELQTSESAAPHTRQAAEFAAPLGQTVSLPQRLDLGDQDSASQARGGIAPEWEEPSSPGAADSPRSSSTAPPPASAVDHDDSIEAYMDRLLARVRGDQSRTPPPPPPALETREPITEIPLPTPPPVAAVEEKPDLSQFMPRRQAPERSRSLAAMRSLANQSARSAIKTHAERSWTEVAKYQLFGAALGLTSGIATFVALDTRPIAGGVALLLGLTAAAAFSWHALRVRKELLASLKADENEPSAEECTADDANGNSPVVPL
jgi:hypothetical protein